MAANKYYLRRGYNASIHGFRTGDFSKSDEIHAQNTETLATIYKRVLSGEVGAIYQNIPGHFVILTRSTRKGVLLQVSHAWRTETGEIIPTSHNNIKCLEDFIKDKYFYEGSYIRELRA